MSIQITIQTLKSEKLPLTIPLDASLSDVKQLCENELKLGDASTMRLIHSGNILKDDQKVGEAGIKEGDFLVVMVSKKKKTKKKKAVITPMDTSTPTPVALSSPVPAPVFATPVPTSTTTTPVVSEAIPMDTDTTPTPTTTTTTTTTTVPSTSTSTEEKQDYQSAASSLVMGSEYEGMVANLMGLGFPHEKVVDALKAAFNNPDRAADYLFNGIPPHIQALVSQQGGQAQPQGQPQQPVVPQQTTEQAIGGGGGGEAAPTMSPEEMQNIANSPQMQQLQQMTANNPQLLQQLLPMLMQQPELAQTLQSNPQAFMQFMQALSQGGAMPGGMPGGAPGGEGGMPQGGGGMPQSTTVQITPEEKSSLDNLEALGFGRQEALRAFLLCDRNEELAANFLFDNAGQDQEEADYQS